MSSMRSSTTWNRVIAHVFWACVVVFSIYFSRTCAKIESHIATLIICHKAYETRSGSLMHDAYLSVLFNSNLNELGIYKKRPCGGLAYWVVMKTNPTLANAFLSIEGRYSGSL